MNRRNFLKATGLLSAGAVASTTTASADLANQRGDNLSEREADNVVRILTEQLGEEFNGGLSLEGVEKREVADGEYVVDLSLGGPFGTTIEAHVDDWY